MRVSSVREDLRAAFQYRLMAVLSIRLSMHGQRTIHHERRDFSDAPANHIRVSEGWCLNMTLELVNQHATCAREAIVDESSGNRKLARTVDQRRSFGDLFGRIRCQEFESTPGPQ